MTQNAKKTVATVTEIERYFDGSERDRIDLTGHSRRVSDLINLREQLLRLPDESYEATILAMRSLLAQARANELGNGDNNANKRDKNAAKELYEAARQKASASSATKPVSKV